MTSQAVDRHRNKASRRSGSFAGFLAALTLLFALLFLAWRSNTPLSPTVGAELPLPSPPEKTAAAIPEGAPAAVSAER